MASAEPNKAADGIGGVLPDRRYHRRLCDDEMKKKTKTNNKRPGPKSIRESTATRTKRAAKILARLAELYPSAECALRHKSALELLVSTILSAQCTDKRINQVTPPLFRRYKTPCDFATADTPELESMIQSTGFFRNKAKNIQGACRVMVDRFDGQVPATMQDLTQLPGVARKTANVILGSWYGKNEGVVVDTHIGRLACRLALTWRSRDSKDAIKIERDLMEVFPREAWTDVGHGLIMHGRQVCSARKPDCEHCELSKMCPSAFAFDDG